MQNKFGLKDLVLFTLVILIGISVWLSMVQRDKESARLQAVQAKVEAIEGSTSRIQRTIDTELSAVRDTVSTLEQRVASGVVLANPGGGNAASSNTGGGSSAVDRDESWARPGVKVTWSKPEGPIETSPRSFPGYQDGGEFISILEGQPPIITPYRYADVYGRYITDEVTESLGRYNPATLRIEGVLADAWQMDPDGMWLRCRIRGNARFSDGEPVTAEDARYTYHDLIWNMQIEADRFRSVYEAIETVTVVSDKVVEFTFKQPKYDNFAQAMLYPIVPKHFYERFTPQQINQSTGLMMGSGPFRLERLDVNSQWTPPNDIVLVRNERYWGPRPALDRIRFKIIQDSIARLTAFDNGQGDMIRPTPQQFDLKRKDERFNQMAEAKDWYNMQGGWSFIAWQCGPRNGGKLTPFADKRVRLAMTHLIDRDRIKRDIYMGLARIGTGPFNSETPQANPEIEPWPYDERKAAELLAEAGWIDRDGDGVRENEKGDRFVFQITYGNGSDSTLQMVTYIKDQCAKIGIVCELNPIDWSILQSILDRRDFDAATFAWSASSPESNPRQLWAISSIEGTGDNFVQWRNEEADGYIQQGETLIDEDARMKVWHQLHRVIHEEQPYTPMFELPWLRLMNKRVGNVQTYKSGLEPSEFFIKSEKAQAN